MSLEKLFHLKENHTDVKTEVFAGITTFMTMAYILAVNPAILADAGMDKGAVFMATALSAFLATCLMAFLSNYPFVLASGMGLNTYFTYTIVLGMGYSWQMALAAVFAEGLIFILLSLTRVREAVFNAIPMNLKYAVSAGIGMFIAFVGLQNAKVVVDSATLVEIYSFKESVGSGSFSYEGITVVLALFGILVTAALVVRGVKGNILWGILITWGAGILCELLGFYVPNPEAGAFSLIPDFSGGISIPSLAPTFLQMDFSKVFTPDMLLAIFALLFVDMFDTLGALMGMGAKAGMLDEQGRLPRAKGALLADAVGTAAGAALGTSTVTTFAESAAGIAEGGRTGLSGVVSGLLFLLAIVFSPIFLAIPSFATAPALVVVGFMMFLSVTQIRWEDSAEAIPCYIAVIAMPFTYSISEGIALGVISYTAISLCTGKFREKKVSALMAVLAILFVVKYVLI